MDLTDIQAFWEDAGDRMASECGPSPTSRDPFLGELERRKIIERLSPDHEVIEVGCGDGSHSVHYAMRARSVLCVDIAQSLLRMARTRFQEAGIANARTLQASVLDLHSLGLAGTVDCAISQRCLINLPNWESQKEAILKVRDVIRPGGLFLLTEGFQDELDNLNLLRSRTGLSAITPVAYNRNFVHSEFDGFIRKNFEVESVEDYGFYLLLSRIYHPLLVSPDEPRHDSKINRVAATIASLAGTRDFRRYSYNLLYVLRKR